jgi:predicted nucleic acid-binding protein
LVVRRRHRRLDWRPRRRRRARSPDRRDRGTRGVASRKHYRRQKNQISLGDCFVLATAADGRTIVTSDRALARSARAEGIEVALVPSGDG